MKGLFDDIEPVPTADVQLGVGTAVLRGFALANEVQIFESLESVASKACFRHMKTPGGQRMSVAMTNCGSLGWTTDSKGYRYTVEDPETKARWPAMPEGFAELARSAAAAAGYQEFSPDACLINRYEPGARLSLHQDRNERDFDQPIVSVSIGLPATFLFGGTSRADKTSKIAIRNGDVLVWGGPARLAFHGIDSLKSGSHPMAGGYRFNLTFRKAG